MTASEGQKRLTDMTDTEQLLRIILSTPSSKAEPFMLWLAQVGREHIEETCGQSQRFERLLVGFIKPSTGALWEVLKKGLTPFLITL